MELWNDLPQQVWKINFVLWMLYGLSLVFFTYLMLHRWHTITKEIERRFILMDVLFFLFLAPFIVTFGWALVMYGGIGVLTIVVDYYGM